MAQDQVRVAFNWTFLTGADSTDPTLAGIWGAFKGSLITMFVTLLISFPVGVLSALYLEEYAPRNRWTDMIEVSINKDRKSTRLNSSHSCASRMPSSA